MKGAKGLYFGASTTPSLTQSLSSTDVAVAVKTLGAKGPCCFEEIDTMADRDRLSRALSEAVSRAVSDALDSALPQTCNRVSHSVAIAF